jgi:hypothetical protein
VVEMEITKTTKLNDLFQKCPEILNLFKKYNLKCGSCKGIAEDTVRNVIVNNGLDEKKFIEEIRKIALQC